MNFWVEEVIGAAQDVAVNCLGSMGQYNERGTLYTISTHDCGKIWYGDLDLNVKENAESLNLLVKRLKQTITISTETKKFNVEYRAYDKE